MATRLISLRLEESDAEWAEAFGRSRGSNRSLVIGEAVRVFREACGGGVPNMPVEKVVKAPLRRSSAPRPKRPPVPEIAGVKTAAELMLERQRRLNDGR